MDENTTSTDKTIIKINEARVESFLEQKVKQSVEDTLNALLDAEADQLAELSATNAVLIELTQEQVTRKESFIPRLEK